MTATMSETGQPPGEGETAGQPMTYGEFRRRLFTYRDMRDLIAEALRRGPGYDLGELRAARDRMAAAWASLEQHAADQLASTTTDTPKENPQ